MIFIFGIVVIIMTDQNKDEKGENGFKLNNLNCNQTQTPRWVKCIDFGH